MALRVEGAGAIGFCSLSLGFGSERNGTGNIVNGIPDVLYSSLCRRSGGRLGLGGEKGSNYQDWKKGPPLEVEVAKQTVEDFGPALSLGRRSLLQPTLRRRGSVDGVDVGGVRGRSVCGRIGRAHV